MVGLQLNLLTNLETWINLFPGIEIEHQSLQKNICITQNWEKTETITFDQRLPANTVIAAVILRKKNVHF